ncbi:hypothetical protein I2494_18455 [Budviciaceae bacterium BWR-B9]|uniref:Uncharacterized protein n=1 Tax=Limnobaculum allomyrinae TaxID=2791986 RepID=A0ABS1IV83_9GAMM|nr:MULTISPECIES: hypothetical protein [Limnobaculum]MBK5145659.1 hypothetical protein [Limnobaculum allomyrinae]MBV7692604.1 hypothetical protein [Limnobaculum sp. M2-1]
MDMTNIACTEKYQTQRKEQETIFTAANFQDSEVIQLSPEYRIEKNTYAQHNTSATENTLLNSKNDIIYRYRNLDDSGDFCKLITHSNGNLYLVFRIELYGYSVFNITENKAFHYIPEENETFIWTDILYNPLNNILVVSGCFWACPFGIHILNFSEPMIETTWVDIHKELEDGYDKYDDIDFARWENDNLILKASEIYQCGETSKSRNIEISISKRQYRMWLDGITDQ